MLQQQPHDCDGAEGSRSTDLIHHPKVSGTVAWKPSVFSHRRAEESTAATRRRRAWVMNRAPAGRRRRISMEEGGAETFTPEGWSPLRQTWRLLKERIHTNFSKHKDFKVREKSSSAFHLLSIRRTCFPSEVQREEVKRDRTYKIKQEVTEDSNINVSSSEDVYRLNLKSEMTFYIFWNILQMCETSLMKSELNQNRVSQPRSELTLLDSLIWLHVSLAAFSFLTSSGWFVTVSFSLKFESTVLQRRHRHTFYIYFPAASAALWPSIRFGWRRSSAHCRPEARRVSERREEEKENNFTEEEEEEEEEEEVWRPAVVSSSKQPDSLTESVTEEVKVWCSALDFTCLWWRRLTADVR